MKARLLVDRLARSHDATVLVKAGTVVDIIRIDRYTDTMTAEHEGKYLLKFTPSQADTVDEDDE